MNSKISFLRKTKAIYIIHAQCTGVGGLEFFFTKMIDSIKMADAELRDFVLEVGAMNYGFNLDGIIGLDLLQKIKAIINLDKLTIEFE